MYRGDLIGCRAGFDEVNEGKIPIFFSLNGEVVAQISLKLGSEKSDIFPFVGMKHKGIRVLAKVCRNQIFAFFFFKPPFVTFFMVSSELFIKRQPHA